MQHLIGALVVLGFILVVTAVRRRENAELRRRAAAHREIPPRAGPERRRLVVFELAELAGHDVAENMVRALEHLGTRAEVLPQQDAPRLFAWLRRFDVRPGLVFFQEDRRVGQTEAVDRLLHVADHEELSPVVGKQPEERVLTGVHVLILIDEHLRIAARKRGGEAVGRVREQLEHQMLLIGEVAHALPFFLGGEGRAELLRQREQRVNGGGVDGQIAQERVGIVGEKLLPFCGGVLEAGPNGDDPLRERVVALIDTAARERTGAGETRLIPAERGGARHVPRGVTGEIKIFAVRLFDLRVPIRLVQPEVELLDPLHPVLRLGARAGEKILPPRRIAGVVPRVGEPFALLGEPRIGVGVALQRFVQPQNKRRELIVVISRAERIHERAYARILFDGLIQLFEELIEHAGADLVGAVRLNDTVVRRDAGEVCVLAQKTTADAVDRADGGAAAQLRLPPETAVHRVGGDALAERGENAAAQLGGCGARIGDDKKLIDVRAAVYIAHEPLDEDLCFAGARSGGNEPRSAAAFGGEFLMVGQGHAVSSSPFSSFSQNSGALNFVLNRQPSAVSLKRQASQ